MQARGYMAIVGSRKVPEWVLEVMIRLGRTLTDYGWAISSGDAFDSDRAGWYGARQSRSYSEVGARIYLASGRGSSFYRIRDNDFFIDASQFTDTWATAASMAALARGSFAGLDDSGKALHTRNVFQIHGHTLDELVSGIFYYAEPKGKREKEIVYGGTNTAVRLSVNANVPIRKNLYYDDVLEWVIQFLDRYELDYPYEEINWHAIHHPKDPRLLDFD